MNLKNLKIQIISDLHLELYSDPQFKDFIDKTDASILALTGDIGIPYLPSYENFLKVCSERYELVFIITGNHEYYQSKNDNEKWSMEMTDNEIEKIVAKFENIKFLNNKHYELNDEYVLLGTTLWSSISGEHNCFVAENCINDYKTIYYSDKNDLKLVTPEYTNSLYEKNVKWLKENLAKYNSRKIIVMSHHLPSHKMITPKFIGSPTNCCFASNLDDLISPNIKYWLCGHTHDNVDIMINNCRCIVNPSGYKYKNVNENMNFKRDLVIDLDYDEKELKKKQQLIDEIMSL